MKHILILLAFCRSLVLSAQVTTAEIENLKKEEQSLKSQIANNEKLLKVAKNDVKSQLNNLMLINAQLGEQQRYVQGIERDVKRLKRDIRLLEQELARLMADLAQCKSQYQRAILYMHRNRITQEKWLFVFSAEDYRTMYRRLRYVTEFSKYQRAQGLIIQEKEEKVRKQQEELNSKKQKQEQLREEGSSQQNKMEETKKDLQAVLNKLKKRQMQLSSTLYQQRKKANDL
ncbi:MAG: peptidase M23, partial [Bacteroidaceae bacterium]|nr:peptidase M23 [Bacteroidaceae bacterium]